MTLKHQLPDLLESYMIKVLPRLRAVGLSLDSDEMLFQGNRAEGGIEIEQSNLPVDIEEVGHINIIW